MLAHFSIGKVDGMQIADKNNQPYEQSFKTLVTVGKSGGKLGVQIILNPLDLAKCVNGRFDNVIATTVEG